MAAAARLVRLELGDAAESLAARGAATLKILVSTKDGTIPSLSLKLTPNLTIMQFARPSSTIQHSIYFMQWEVSDFKLLAAPA
jgi:hypothetical protein